MKKGDRVTIYIDPVTKLRPEGRATLVRRFFSGPEPGPFVKWWVKFDDSPGEWMRDIYKED